MSEVDSFLAGNGWGSKAFYAFARFIVAGLTRLYTRMTIEGREKLPRTGPYVLAPVHRSYVDTFISGCLTRRRLRFMGKHTMWKNRLFGWLLSSLGGFPVVRGTADREAVRRCITVLESGEPLVLYPEGERKSGPTVQPLLDGAVYIALRAGVPIIPVGIGGSERVWAKGKKAPRPSKVHVIVGDAILPSALEAAGAASGRTGSSPLNDAVDPTRRKPVSRSAIHSMSDELHVTLQKLFDEAQRRVGQLQKLDSADAR